MSETIPVTGGAGYTGSHAMVQFLQEGMQAAVLGDLCADNLPGHYAEPSLASKALGWQTNNPEGHQ